MWYSNGYLGCVLGTKTRNCEEQPELNAEDCEGSIGSPWDTHKTNVQSARASSSGRHLWNDDCSGPARSLIKCRN
jgi:hypothetical protein